MRDGRSQVPVGIKKRGALTKLGGDVCGLVYHKTIVSGMKPVLPSSRWRLDGLIFVRKRQRRVGRGAWQREREPIGGHRFDFRGVLFQAAAARQA